VTHYQSRGAPRSERASNADLRTRILTELGELLYFAARRTAKVPQRQAFAAWGRHDHGHTGGYDLQTYETLG